MVFFTCIIIILILYYMQSEGLIFVTIIALVGELINIFLTQTVTKSVENKQKRKYSKIIEALKQQVAKKDKSIDELKQVHEESARVLYKANIKIREYEAKLGIQNDGKDIIPEKLRAVAGKEPGAAAPVTARAKKTLPERPEKFDFNDLPPGSNRKKLPG